MKGVEMWWDLLYGGKCCQGQSMYVWLAVGIGNLHSGDVDVGEPHFHRSFRYGGTSGMART